MIPEEQAGGRVRAGGNMIPATWQVTDNRLSDGSHEKRAGDPAAAQTAVYHSHRPPKRNHMIPEEPMAVLVAFVTAFSASSSIRSASFYGFISGTN